MCQKTSYHLSPSWTHCVPVIIPYQIPLLCHLNQQWCWIFKNALCGNYKFVVHNLRHAVSTLRLQGQSSQVQSSVLMAGQPVLQKVSPELEVILVAGLFVPSREDGIHFEILPEFKKHIFIFGNKTRKGNTYKRREMSLTKNLTLKKRTKVVVGTFFQLSGATLEILVSFSTKKNSLSEERTEKYCEL